jgi:hypothetical protein
MTWHDAGPIQGPPGTPGTGGPLIREHDRTWRPAVPAGSPVVGPVNIPLSYIIPGALIVVRYSLSVAQPDPPESMHLNWHLGGELGSEWGAAGTANFAAAEFAPGQSVIEGRVQFMIVTDPPADVLGVHARHLNTVIPWVPAGRMIPTTMRPITNPPNFAASPWADPQSFVIRHNSSAVTVNFSDSLFEFWPPVPPVT